MTWQEEFKVFLNKLDVDYKGKTFTKVMEYLDTQGIQPRSKKVFDFLKLNRELEEKNKELLKLIDQLTTEKAELSVTLVAERCKNDIGRYTSHKYANYLLTLANGGHFYIQTEADTPFNELQKRISELAAKEEWDLRDSTTILSIGRVNADFVV